MIGGYIGKPIGAAQRTSDGISAVVSQTLADATLAATATVALKGTLTKTLDDATLAATGTVSLKAAAAATLADATLAATGAVALKGAVTATLDGVSLSFTGAIQVKAVLNVTLDDVIQSIVGDFTTTITDTEVLPLPINCVLAGHQPYKFSETEYSIPPYRRTHHTAVRKSGVAKLRGGKSSFTSKTNSRGYD